MGDRVLVVRAVEHLEHAQIDSGGPDVAGLQDDPDPVVGPRGSAAAGDPPAAVHLQMRVDAGVADADEQVLAPAEHLVDDPTGQVDRGVARHADVAAGERGAHQGLAQHGRGAEDGVAFGHQASLTMLMGHLPGRLGPFVTWAHRRSAVL